MNDLAFYIGNQCTSFFSQNLRKEYLTNRVKLVNHWSELPYFNMTTTIKMVSHFQQDVRLNCPMKWIVIQPNWWVAHNVYLLIEHTLALVNLCLLY